MATRLDLLSANQRGDVPDDMREKAAELRQLARQVRAESSSKEQSNGR
jgi:hypothetical protein